MLDKLFNVEKAVTGKIGDALKSVAKEFNCNTASVWIMIKSENESGNFSLFAYNGKQLLREMKLEEII
jgi:hypothetical protein